MLRYVEGDILLTKAAAMAHGVAPMDHFDSGLALSLRERFPSMYKDFRHYCQTFHPKPGDVWLWQGVDHNKIFNLLTQEPPLGNTGHPGRASTINLRHCLKNLVHEIEKENIKSLAIPRLATGVGGLHWEDVNPLLEEYLEPLSIPVYVYSVYRKGVAATE